MPSKARRKKDDDSSSSSDSDSDCEQTVSNGAEDSKPLSLLDDDVNDVLILPPTEDAGELESGKSKELFHLFTMTVRLYYNCKYCMRIRITKES